VRRLVARGPVAAQQVSIPVDDPLGAYFLAEPGPTRIDNLRLDSPLLNRLQGAGVQLVVPLVTQGELIGVFNLGPRRSEQEYSADDRRLLSNLASQAASAVRVAQLIKEQQAEFRTRERLDQELHVARLIQQTMLPKELPSLPDWRLAAYYKPARAVGGDFYDFVTFEDGRVGLIIGDVSDKGVPAALVMATTRSMLRAAVADGVSPGQALARANESLCREIPAKMFVTCLYAILEPATGRLRFANAGHDLPYHRHGAGADALVARGMPLGLMPGMRYEENECTLARGDSILLYSDGLVEAHNPAREMFDDPRLKQLVGDYGAADALEAQQPLIDYLLAQLATFVGPEWEQEDDITLVTLRRSMGEGLSEIAIAPTAVTTRSTDPPLTRVERRQIDRAPFAAPISQSER
jgi:serine phosphatase RsbU (regulator of sigma subunit)